MNWRAIAFAVIVEIEERYRNESYGALKRALYDAYPFGSRENYPYKVWCEEQKAALRRHPECPDKQSLGELFEKPNRRPRNDLPHLHAPDATHHPLRVLGVRERTLHVGQPGVREIHATETKDERKAK